MLTVFLAAGCSIDRVEWESTGFPIDEVRHALEEEHHADNPTVECIKREVQGAEWECRAHTQEAEFHCHVTANEPRKRIYELHCETAHDDGTGEGEDHDEDGASTVEHGEDESNADDSTGHADETETE